MQAWLKVSQDQSPAGKQDWYISLLSYLSLPVIHGAISSKIHLLRPPWYIYKLTLDRLDVKNSKVW